MSQGHIAQHTLKPKFKLQHQLTSKHHRCRYEFQRNLGLSLIVQGPAVTSFMPSGPTQHWPGWLRITSPQDLMHYLRGSLKITYRKGVVYFYLCLNTLEGIEDFTSVPTPFLNPQTYLSTIRSSMPAFSSPFIS